MTQFIIIFGISQVIEALTLGIFLFFFMRRKKQGGKNFTSSPTIEPSRERINQNK